MRDDPILRVWNGKRLQPDAKSSRISGFLRGNQVLQLLSESLSRIRIARIFCCLGRQPRGKGQAQKYKYEDPSHARLRERKRHSSIEVYDSAVTQYIFFPVILAGVLIAVSVVLYLRWR